MAPFESADLAAAVYRKSFNGMTIAEALYANKAVDQ